MKYIDAAMERLKTKQSLDERDLSLVERILAGESDPKTAYILALDLILVGIDTVSSVTLPLGQPVIQFTTAKGQLICLYQGNYVSCQYQLTVQVQNKR
jgi:hypothetical protein